MSRIVKLPVGWGLRRQSDKGANQWLVHDDEGYGTVSGPTVAKATMKAQLYQERRDRRRLELKNKKCPECGGKLLQVKHYGMDHLVHADYTKAHHFRERLLESIAESARRLRAWQKKGHKMLVASCMSDLDRQLAELQVVDQHGTEKP